MSAIPGIMVDIGANVARMQADMRSISGIMQGEFGKIERTALGIGKVLAGIVGIGTFGEFIKFVTAAYMEQEKAENALSVAMKNNRDYTAQAHASLVEYAGQLQKTTTITDEAAISAMAVLKSFGMSDEVVKKTTTAIADLSIGMGVDLTTAANLMGKAFMGNTTMLGRHGFVIDEGKKGMEKYDAILKQIQDRYGGRAQSELDTYSGRWQNFKNIIGEAAESVGKFVLDMTHGGPPMAAFTKALQEESSIITESGYMRWVKEIHPKLVEDIIKEGDAWEYLTGKVSKFLPVSQETIQATEKIKDALTKIRLEMTLVGASDVQKRIANIQLEAKEFEKAQVDQEKILEYTTEKKKLLQKEESYRLQKALLADRDFLLAEWETKPLFSADSVIKEFDKVTEAGKKSWQMVQDWWTAEQPAWDVKPILSAADAIGLYNLALAQAGNAMEKADDMARGLNESMAKPRFPVEDYIAIMQQNESVSHRRLSAEQKIYGELRNYSDLYYESQVRVLEKLGEDYRKLGLDEKAVAEWVYQERLNASQKWEDGAIRSMRNYAAEAGNAAKNTELVFTNAFKTLEDALVDFVKTGKLNFKTLIDSILTDIARLTIRQNITGPGSSWLSEIFKNMFGGGGGGGATGPYEYGYTGHGGGIIGASNLPMRALPSAYFATAPRFHSGLQPDEFPTILKRGEGVFTPEQMRAMGSRTEISINIPISVPNADARKMSRMGRDLEAELEPVVKRIIGRYV